MIFFFFFTDEKGLDRTVQVDGEECSSQDRDRHDENLIVSWEVT